jgi:hypothetical protein
MRADPVTAALPPPRVEPRRALHTDRLFFGGMSLLIALTVVAGFGPSSFFRSAVEAPLELSGLMHAHGAAFTAWIVLLLAQNALVLGNRRDLHRLLGFASIGLAAVMIVLGARLAVEQAAAGTLGGLGEVNPVAVPFLAVPLVSVIIVFPALFGAAVYFRKRTATHKRLVLLATLDLMTAAIARLPGVTTPLGFFGITDLFLVAMIVYDLQTLGRVHAATLAGGAVLIGCQVGRVLLMGSSTWLAFAQWLTA